MKALAVVFPGTEEAASMEIKKIIGKSVKIDDSVVIFDASDKDIAKLCYKAQTLQRVIGLFSGFPISEDFGKFEKEIVKNLDVKDYKDLENKTFKVKCKRVGEHGFQSKDVEAFVGSVILKSVDAKVKMNGVDREIFVYIFNNMCYIGLDFCGFDLSKREYKVFTHSTDFNGAIASSFLYYLDFKGEKIVDPFCTNGTLMIEASLINSGKSVHYFNKEKFLFRKFLDVDVGKFDGVCKDKCEIYGYDSLMRNVSSAKKNAKIAGVDKLINFSRVDVDWLDTKFNEGEVGAILTKCPEPSKTFAEKDASKLIKELFHQAKFVLEKKGKIGLICEKVDFIKGCVEEFSIKKEIEVMQGKKKMWFLIFKKTI
jgi:putative N6-adenine-specific DNA methylase